MALNRYGLLQGAPTVRRLWKCLTLEGVNLPIGTRAKFCNKRTDARTPKVGCRVSVLMTWALRICQLFSWAKDA